MTNQTPRLGDSPERYRIQDAADLNEVSLIHKAGPLAKAFAGRLPTQKELRNVTEELGIEIATTFFSQCLLESKTHGPFARAVRSFHMGAWTERKPLAGKFEVTLIASNLHQSGREWGDHVDLWRSWARGLGFTTDVISTLPSNSVSANARVISDHLISNPHPNRILVTYGQGAAELRFLLQKRNYSGFELDSIAAWLNICGAYGGSSLSQLQTEGRLRRWLTQWSMKRAGRNPLSLFETSATYPVWTGGHGWKPKGGLLVVNILGLPQRWQMPSPFRSPYAELAKKSPNDGVLTTHEACAPGLIIGIPGMSHQAESGLLEPIYKRTLGVVLESLKVRVAHMSDAMEIDLRRENFRS